MSTLEAWATLTTLTWSDAAGHTLGKASSARHPSAGSSPTSSRPARGQCSRAYLAYKAAGEQFTPPRERRWCNSGYDAIGALRRVTLPDGGKSERRSDLPGRRVGHTLADTEPHPAWSTPPAASGCACSPPANAYGFTSTCSIVLTTGHHPADNYVSIGTLSKYDLAAETAKGFGPGANAIDNTLGLGNDIGEVAVNGPSFATSVA